MPSGAGDSQECSFGAEQNFSNWQAVHLINGKYWALRMKSRTMWVSRQKRLHKFFAVPPSKKTRRRLYKPIQHNYKPHGPAMPGRDCAGKKGKR